MDALVVPTEALDMGKKVGAQLEAHALMRCGQAGEPAGDDLVAQPSLGW